MSAGNKPRLLRWRDTHELFNTQVSILVFMIDCLDEQWSNVPPDVLAMLETMQSTAKAPVRLFEVGFRVDADFLSLFSTEPGPSVVRRMAGGDTFELLRPGFGFSQLIEFCRHAYEPPQLAQAFVTADPGKPTASGEIVL